MNNLRSRLLKCPRDGVMVLCLPRLWRNGRKRSRPQPLPQTRASNPFSPRRQRPVWNLLVFILLLLMVKTEAQTPTGVQRWWRGNGPSGFWSDPLNWDGNEAPSAGDDLIFNPASSKPTTNDYPGGTVFGYIRSFTGTVIHGESFTLLNGMDCDGSMEVHAPIVVAQNQTFSSSAYSSFENVEISADVLTLRALSDSWYRFSRFNFFGEISGRGGIATSGDGAITIYGSNSFGGPLIVNTGILRVERYGNLGSSAAGTTVASGAAIILRGPTLPEPFSLGGAILTEDSSSNVLSGPITLISTNPSVQVGNHAYLRLDGALTAALSNTTISMTATGQLVLTGTNSYGRSLISYGPLTVQGYQPESDVEINRLVSWFDGYLTGHGTVQNIYGTAGIVAPGDPLGVSFGVLTCSNLELSSDCQLIVQLARPIPGGQDQVVVRGKVILHEARLSVTNYSAPLGTSFVIISNEGSEGVQGEFAGLPEGGTVGGFRISYRGGDGNDITLTRTLNAPASTILSLHRLNNGLLQLRGKGEPGLPYFVETSATMLPPVPWVTISTNSTDSSGFYQFIETISSSQGFFRVRSP